MRNCCGCPKLNLAPPDYMATFCCKNCGQKIFVPGTPPGKRGKCPKCGDIVIVPKEETVEMAANHAPPPASRPLRLDPAVFDIPQSDAAHNLSAGAEHAPDSLSEDIQKLERESGARSLQPVCKRKFPWFVDVLLYPISVPGLTVLAIIILIPLLIGLVARLFGPLGFFVSIPGFVINVVIGLYCYWYFCRCIRDSALGGLRAPDVLVDAPDLDEMAAQTIKVAGCAVVLFLPALIYYHHTGRTDTAFKALLGGALFLFPMALLAVIMFDSFVGLNPLLLIPSILSTFLPYCATVVAFCSAFYCIIELLPDARQWPLLALLLRSLGLYLALVAAHILGWFYCRYQRRLNWEV